MAQRAPLYTMYSATRQWNPGDEFILAGTRRIIDTALGATTPLLYDRNPDVRPSDGTTVGYRNLKRPLNESAGAIYEGLAARLRLGFFSNSVKFDSDLSYAHLAVLAGSPEWATPRCWSFYDHTFRNRLPLIGLGLGSMPDDVPPFVEAALGEARLLTTRSRSLSRSELAQRFAIEYLPCPALLSAPAGRQVESVRRVGIVLGVPYERSVWANGLETEFYEAACAALEHLFAHYGDSVAFEFVLHYIDELPVIQDRFPDHPIRYSFDSGDYAEIFADYDLVISTRIHGCGIAGSLGIPSISLGHDFRADTADGFLSVTVDPRKAPDELSRSFEELAGRADLTSRELGTHRTATLEEYVTRLRDRLPNGPEPVDYGGAGRVDFSATNTSTGLLDAPQLEQLFQVLTDLGTELDAARASNDELRSVLTAVENSKAEIALELDGARAAVVRLEGELQDRPRRWF